MSAETLGGDLLQEVTEGSLDVVRVFLYNRNPAKFGKTVIPMKYSSFYVLLEIRSLNRRLNSACQY